MSTTFHFSSVNSERCTFNLTTQYTSAYYNYSCKSDKGYHKNLGERLLIVKLLTHVINPHLSTREGEVKLHINLGFTYLAEILFSNWRRKRPAFACDER